MPVGGRDATAPETTWDEVWSYSSLIIHSICSIFHSMCSIVILYNEELHQIYNIPLGIRVILYLLMHLVAWNRISGHVETAVCVVMGIWHQPINQLLAFSAPKSHLYYNIIYYNVELRWFYGLCWHFAFIRFNKQHFVSSGLLRVPNTCRLCYCCSAFPAFLFYYMFRFRDNLSVGVFTRFCIWEQHRVLAKRRSTVGVTEKTITLVTVTS